MEPTPTSGREDVEQFLDRLSWQRAEEERLLDLEGYPAGVEPSRDDETME